MIDWIDISNHVISILSQTFWPFYVFKQFNRKENIEVRTIPWMLGENKKSEYYAKYGKSQVNTKNITYFNSSNFANFIVKA